MSTQILAIDPDPLAGKLLTFLLSDAGYDVITLADPRCASQVLREQHVDLVLLETILPHLDGFALCATLRHDYPDVPMILVSARASVADKVHGLGRGADDYIAKPFDPAELLARIQSVLRRYCQTERYRDGATIKVGEATLHLNELRFSAPHIAAALLTPREMNLLECLMRNAQRVCTREGLLERVWGYEYDGVRNRVDVYIRRLRMKIEEDASEPAYIHTVREQGYLFRDPQRARVYSMSRLA